MHRFDFQRGEGETKCSFRNVANVSARSLGYATIPIMIAVVLIRLWGINLGGERNPPHDSV
jgi:hypothetical protein